MTNLGKVIFIVSACCILTMVAGGRSYNRLSAFSGVYHFLDTGDWHISDDSYNSPKIRVSQSGKVACGQPVIQPLNVSLHATIVNGIPAKLGSWPYVVSLRFNENHVCGGAVLNYQWIVTAAHCFDKKAHLVEFWKVHLGRYTKNDDDITIEERKVEKIFKPNNYGVASRYDNDIALIKLKDVVSYTEFIRPICLPTSEPAEGEDCVVAGWGETKERSDLLNQLTVPILSWRVCHAAYYREVFTENMICAGYMEGAKDTCKGDSGGPLMCKREVDGAWELSGIISWGIGCARPGKPSVFTNSYKFVDWIKDTMENN